jgi:chorismate lyase/3-hydroxybenzoate synthase
LQTLETLKNLEALLQAADYPPLASLSAESSFSIYLREPRDRSIVESLLNERIAPEVTRLFLQGDICRQDLMVEIEGLIAG